MPVHIVERLQKMNRAERTLWTPVGRRGDLEDRRRGEPADPASARGASGRPCMSSAPTSRSANRGHGAFGDFVAGDDPLPEEEVEVSLRSQALGAALLSLQERERQVLHTRRARLEQLRRRRQSRRSGGVWGSPASVSVRSTEVPPAPVDAARDAVGDCVRPSATCRLEQLRALSPSRCSASV